jgi:hypothetical protein
VQGANQHLRDGLHAAAQERDAALGQLRALQSLQQELQAGVPGAAQLAAAAVAQERAAHAARDAQVLQLLRAKVGCYH